MDKIYRREKKLAIHHSKENKANNIRVIKESICKDWFGNITYIERIDIIAKYIYSFTQNQADLPKRPYNPRSHKNRNDGIDFLIILNIILPSLICSMEYFIDKFRSIDSYQNKWFYKPEELAKAWKDKKIITPRFNEFTEIYTTGKK